MRLLRPLLALAILATAAPSAAIQGAPAQSQAARQAARQAMEPYLGLYRFGRGEFVTVNWLDDIGGLLAIEYPSGRIRSLHPHGAGHFTTGPTVVADQPVEAQLAFAPNGLTWTEDGRDRVATRAVYPQQDVTIRSGDVTLAGTLTLPKGKGPFPAVVLLHGGGPQDRNFLWVAPFFAEHGVAVLAYDKRGAGRSTGDWRNATSRDLAGDAIAAVDLLRSRANIDPGRIGLYGSSNGGWVAPLAATLAPDRIAFIVARSASGLPERKNIVYEVEGDLRQAGFGDDVVNEVRNLHIRDIQLLRTNGAGWNDFRTQLASVAGQPWFRLTRLPADLEPMNDANRPGIERWIASQKRAWVEPGDLWERISCPVLVQIGTRDRLVPPGPSRDLITAGLTRAHNRNAEVRLYQGGDHGLFESPSGFMSDIGKVTRLTPGYLTDLSAWIDRNVSGRQAPRGKGCGLAAHRGGEAV